MIWVLLVIGFIGLVIFIERTLYLHRGQIRSTAFIGGIKNILAKRRIVEALTVCEETPGPVAAVTKAALLHADDDPEKMRFYVQEAAVVELPALERRIGALAAIAQVAPLVGLLGTVLGMVTTFVAFEQDYATASVLSKGMWQALLNDRKVRVDGCVKYNIARRVGNKSRSARAPASVFASVRTCVARSQRLSSSARSKTRGSMTWNSAGPQEGRTSVSLNDCVTASARG